jgi:hypothetical protein
VPRLGVRGKEKQLSPDLGQAHKGYAYQDLVSAFLLADGLIKGHKTTVDTKLHALDIFDDISTEDQHRRVRRQFKSGTPQRLLQLSDLKTQRSETRIDQLIRSVKADPTPASEYRLCVTWKVDLTDPITEFLVPFEAESTFGPHKTKIFKLRLQMIWPASQPPTWDALSFATDLSKEDLVGFCDRFLIETDCPLASLNLEQIGPLETLLIRKLNQEIGIGKYPNDHLEPVEAVALLITLGTRARIQHQVVHSHNTISFLGLRTDYGRVAQRFPVNENLLVKTDALLADLKKKAKKSSRLIVTGEPGCGKSWALTQLAGELLEEGSIVTRHYCYLEPGDPDVQKRILTNTLFGNLIAELAAENPELSKIIRPRFSAGPDELEDLLKQLHDASLDKRIYLVVDGLDHISRVFADSSQISADEIDIVDRIALLTLPENVCLIVGSQPGDHLAPLAELADGFQMPAWNSQDILRLSNRIGVEEALAEAGLEQSIERFERELVLRSEGNPLYTTFICKQIKDQILAGSLVNDPVAAINDVPVHQGDLGRYYGYLLSGEEGAATADVAEILGVVDFSLTKSELGEILPSAVHRIDKALSRMSPIIERIAMQGGIRIYHESFRRYIVHRLQQSGASISAILSPVIEWLYKRNFYKDAKSYRFLISCLRRAQRHNEIYELCNSSFVIDSIEAGHGPDAMIQNLLMMIDTASRSADWPVMARASELQRALATFVNEGLHAERFGRTFAAVHGASALNERLLFEGRPTYSREIGLVLCSLCDDEEQNPPWREYTDLDRDLSRDDQLDEATDLATFHAFIRIRGPEVALKALADFLQGPGLLPPRARAYIHRLRKTGGVELLERLSHAPNISRAASWLVLSTLATVASKEGQPERALEIATRLLGQNPDIETAFESIKIGAPISTYDTSSISLGSYDIGVGTKHYFDDESSVRAWVSAVGILAFGGDPRLDGEIARLKGEGWYRCWLKYVIGLSKGEALFAQKSLRSEDVVAAFEVLESDTSPFVGTPRACDLYRIHELIHETFERGLALLRSKAEWQAALAVLYEVSIHTTTYLQGDASGPLEPEALFRLLQPYTKVEEIRELVVQTIEDRLSTSVKAGGLYYRHASQDLLLAEISAGTGNASKALAHWKSASRYMCAYGQRKDITIYELLDSVEFLPQNAGGSKEKAVQDLQALVDAVVDHTDGRSISGTPVSWYKNLYEIDPVAATLILCKSLLRSGGRYDWRLESAAAFVVERNLDRTDPLVLSLLCFASPPGEERVSDSVSLRAVEKTLSVYPTVGAELLQMFYVTMTGDAVGQDLVLIERMRKLLADLNVNIPNVTDLDSGKSLSKAALPEGGIRRKARLTSDEQFHLPDTRSLPAIMKAIAKVTTETLETPPDRDRFVNLIGFWLVELTFQGKHSEVETFLRYLARHRWFTTDATHLADLADGFTRFGLSKIAAIAYTFAFTRSRGGGGWLSFGDTNHIKWLIKAHELSPDTALLILAEEVGRYLDGSSFSYGVTQHLIEALSTLGHKEVSLSMWREAFTVIDHRLPREADEAGIFAKYEQQELELSVEDSLVLLLITRISCPFQPIKSAALASLARLFAIVPERLAKAFATFFSLDPPPSSQLAILALFVEFDLAHNSIAQHIKGALERLALSDKFGVSESAKLLLRRNAREAPLGRTTVLLPALPVAKRKEKAIRSLDLGDRVEIIERIWEEFPSLLAARFDHLWNDPQLSNRSRWQSRERLARSLSRKSYPRARVLSWSHEVFESVFHEVLNVHTIALDGEETDPHIARYLLRRILPDIRSYVAYWHSRTLRPPMLLPVESTSQSGSVVPLSSQDDYAGWVRCGLYEEQLVLKGEDIFAECIKEVTITGGVVSAPEGALKKGSLPLGIGHVGLWWEGFSDHSIAQESRYKGPLLGFSFLASFVGVYPLLIPHRRYLTSLSPTLRAQPGPFELVDGNGHPCVRFRWWKVRPLGNDLDESASRLRGCDLVMRRDVWESVAQNLKQPVVFETAFAERELKPQKE